MSSIAANLPASMATGVEQGIVALLGSKSSRVLMTLVSHEELILLCCALLAIASAIPRNVILMGRVSSVLAQVFGTIALNTTLSAVVNPRDPALTCINLLGVFFFGSALQQENSSVTAQYLLVANLSSTLRTFKENTLPLAWALALVPSSLHISQDIVDISRLVTVETFTGWFRDILPKGTLLTSTLVLLYLTIPFSAQFPLLSRMYRFAVFAVSNDPQLHSTPVWILSVWLWAVWFLDSDNTPNTSTTKTFAAMAGSNLGVLVILDSIQFALNNDPVPVLITLLVAIQILEEAHAPPHRNN